MFSRFFSIMLLSLSKGTTDYLFSSAKFPFYVNCLTETPHLVNFLLVCWEFAWELGWILLVGLFPEGLDQSQLWVRAIPGPTRSCGGMGNGGSGTGKESDAPEPVLLPFKRNIHIFSLSDSGNPSFWLLKNLRFYWWAPGHAARCALSGATPLRITDTPTKNSQKEKPEIPKLNFPKSNRLLPPVWPLLFGDLFFISSQFSDSRHP